SWRYSASTSHCRTTDFGPQLPSCRPPADVGATTRGSGWAWNASTMLARRRSAEASDAESCAGGRSYGAFVAAMLGDHLRCVAHARERRHARGVVRIVAVRAPQCATFDPDQDRPPIA